MHRRLVTALALCLLLPAPAAARRHRRRHKPPPVVTRPAPPRAAAVVPRSHCTGPGWVWVPGHPGPRGWIRGQCIYKGSPPRPGWVYVSGYWRKGKWIRGFWRPPARDGYRWVEATGSESGEYQPGYWEPEEDGPPDHIWRPGYWDGERWVPGAWVPSESYSVYDENGELAFIGFGDGEIEELAIPDESGGVIEDTSEEASPEQASETGDTGLEGDEAPETLDVEESEVEGTDVRHHLPPD